MTLFQKDNKGGSATSKKSLPLEVAVAEKVANVLDDHHVDPVVGLILPGVGDIACGIVGLGVVALAASRKVAKVTLARMVVNLALSVGVGAIPLLGDAFDFWFRANSRNARLLARAERGRKSTWGDVAFLAVAALGLVVALAVPVVLTVFLVRYGMAHWGQTQLAAPQL